MEMVSCRNTSTANGSDGPTSTDNLTGTNTVVVQMHVNRAETVLMVDLNVVPCSAAPSGNRDYPCTGCHNRRTGGGVEVNSLMIA